MKKISKLTIVSAFILALLAAGCGGGNGSSSGSSEKQIKIKFAHVNTPDTPKGKGAEKFSELADKYTNGRVKVEVFPSGQLYGDKEELEALMSGNVQMIAPSVTKLVSLNHSFQIIDLPFFWKNEQHLYSFWDGELGQKLFNSLDKHKIKGLALWPNGDKHFTSKGHPLLTPEQFKGVKFRIPSGDIQERQYQLLGSAAVTIPFNESYIALQQGTVDATENTLSNIYSMKYSEVQDYLTLVGFGRVDYAILANNDFWTKLPDDVRGNLERALKEATQYERDLANKLNQDSLEKMKQEGKFKIVEMKEEQKDAFSALLQPLYKEYESKIGKDLIDAAAQLAK